MRRKDGKPRKDCKIAKCWNQVLSDYRNGMTLAQLSKKYKIDNSNIYRFFKIRGIKLRSRSEASRLGFKLGRMKSRDGENSPFWRGGKTKHSKGYILIKMPSHHRSDSRGYVSEAIIFAEKKIGRLLRDDEIVHHINRNKTDNRLSNLKIMTRSEHNRMHGLEGASKRWYGDKNYLTNRNLCPYGSKARVIG